MTYRLLYPVSENTSHLYIITLYLYLFHQTVMAEIFLNECQPHQPIRFFSVFQKFLNFFQKKFKMFSFKKIIKRPKLTILYNIICTHITDLTTKVVKSISDKKKT